MGDRQRETANGDFPEELESGCPIRKRKLIHRDFVVEDRASSRPFMFGRWTNKRMVEAFNIVSLPLSRCSNAKIIAYTNQDQGSH